jgi:putative endonuclease
MTPKQALGKRGEQLALQLLEQSGYTLLEQNWRHRRAEIDLIMMEGPTLVFVEVKTRSTDAFGHPLEFVRKRQTDLLSSAASAYMEAIGHDWELRFDLVSVIIEADGSYRLELVKDAFFPGLYDW